MGKLNINTTIENDLKSLQQEYNAAMGAISTLKRVKGALAGLVAAVNADASGAQVNYTAAEEVDVQSVIDDIFITEVGKI